MGGLRILAGLAALGVLLLALLLAPRYGTWGAKRWCEELATRMEDNRTAVEADPLHVKQLQEGIGWYPTLFQDAHTLGWTIHDEGVEVSFSTSAGSHSYDSASETWTSGPSVRTVEVFPGE